MLGDMPNGGGSEGEIRTFLIADVRGYTRFTQEQGDERAAALAGAFALLARSAVSEFGGDVIEVRGDEALAVFSSARQALRAAVEIQRRARTASSEGVQFPLGIGLGLDAGEAVPLDGGYRGGALNLASRLCSLAKPGEILVSETVVGLARRVDGIRFQKRRAARLKGLEEPVPVNEAVPDPPLPPLPAPEPVRRSFVRRHKWQLLAATALASGLAVALPLTLTSGGGTGGISQTAISVPRSFEGLVRIDPRTNEVAKRISLAGQHLAAFAYGSLWVTEPNGIDRVNPQTGQILGRFPVTGATENLGLAASTQEGVWFSNPEFEPYALSEIDAYRETVTQRLQLPGRPTAGPYVGAGFVWLVISGNTIFKIDPANGNVVDRIPYNFPSRGTALAASAGEGALWIADPQGLAPGQGLKFGVVARVDANTDEVTQIPVRAVNEIAVGGGAVWAGSYKVDPQGDTPGNPGTNEITEINPATSRIIRPIKVMRADGITAGDGAVWVENDLNHIAVRINPANGEIVSKLSLPITTKAIGELGDSLWVGVWR